MTFYTDKSLSRVLNNEKKLNSLRFQLQLFTLILTYSKRKVMNSSGNPIGSEFPEVGGSIDLHPVVPEG